MFGLDVHNLLILLFIHYFIFYVPFIFNIPDAITSVCIHSTLKIIIFKLCIGQEKCFQNLCGMISCKICSWRMGEYIAI